MIRHIDLSSTRRIFDRYSYVHFTFFDSPIFTLEWLDLTINLFVDYIKIGHPIRKRLDCARYINFEKLTKASGIWNLFHSYNVFYRYNFGIFSDIFLFFLVKVSYSVSRIESEKEQINYFIKKILYQFVKL